MFLSLVLVWSCIVFQWQQILAEHCYSDFHEVCTNDIRSLLNQRTLSTTKNGTREEQDGERTQRFPWIHSSEEQCRHLAVNFAPLGSLRMKALVSYPGSGNTWLRLVIN